MGNRKHGSTVIDLGDVITDLYSQYNGRWLNSRNKLPPQLRRRLHVFDLVNSDIVSASDNEESALAVTVDLHPATAIDAEATSERVEEHQGLGHGRLEPGHVEEIGGGGVVVEQVECWCVPLLAIRRSREDSQSPFFGVGSLGATNDGSTTLTSKCSINSSSSQAAT
ncbi:unnamed protein product [Urochloa humidicola]